MKVERRREKQTQTDSGLMKVESGREKQRDRQTDSRLMKMERERGRERGSRLMKVETKNLPGRHKFPPSSHLWLWHSQPVFENFHNSLNATPFQFHVSIFLMKMFFHPARHKSFTGKENQAEKAVPLSQYAIWL